MKRQRHGSLRQPAVLGRHHAGHRDRRQQVLDARRSEPRSSVCAPTSGGVSLRRAALICADGSCPTPGSSARADRRARRDSAVRPTRRRLRLPAASRANTEPGPIRRTNAGFASSPPICCWHA
jgi:hypothetical protein